MPEKRNKQVGELRSLVALAGGHGTPAPEIFEQPGGTGTVIEPVDPTAPFEVSGGTAGGALSAAFGTGATTLDPEDFACASGVAGNGSSDGSNFAASQGQATGGYATGLSGGNCSGSFGLAVGSESNADTFCDMALGESCTASGGGSVAMGANCTASYLNCFAAGNGCLAYGNGAVALGIDTIASGDYSTATGINTIASGVATTAAGDGAIAGGYGARAFAGGSGYNSYPADVLVAQGGSELVLRGQSVEGSSAFLTGGNPPTNEGFNTDTNFAYTMTVDAVAVNYLGTALAAFCYKLLISSTSGATIISQESLGPAPTGGAAAWTLTFTTSAFQVEFVFNPHGGTETINVAAVVSWTLVSIPE